MTPHGKWSNIDSDSEHCTPDYFCSNNSTIKWQRDDDNPRSLDNLMKEYKMDCESKLVISMFGMMFFTGYAIGNIILPTLSDKYGRKWFFVMTMFVSFFSYVTLLALPSDNHFCIYIIISLFFIGGLNSSGRMMIGFCYMVEMAPKTHQSLMCTVWDIHDGTIMIWVTLMYIYVGKGWRWTMYWASAVQFICIILISFFLPESPKWLYS